MKGRIKMKTYYIYIMGDQRKNKFYIDVTDNLVCTLAESECPSFPAAKNFNPDYKLVYFEETNIFDAVEFKIQFDSWDKFTKMLWIDKFNPRWNDLFLEYMFESSKEIQNTY